MNKVSVVVPNWNGAEQLPACLNSLLDQSLKPQIIVVDNGSSDGSIELLRKKYSGVQVIARDKNYGFTGGVNPGIKAAIEGGGKYVALLNNDAVADPGWLKALVGVLDQAEKAGVVTSKIVNHTGEYIDSTGDFYTTWGLPYPRGRREANLSKYDQDRLIFGASGGASLYRVKMLEEIGLFDDDFFAYYEDVDLSFRAQLAGWQVVFASDAKVNHYIGATSGRISGFATYHTMKNLPMLFWKNVPWRLIPAMLPRFKLAYLGLLTSAIARGEGWPAFKGLAVFLALLPKKLVQRHKIQSTKKLTTEQVSALLVHDLPPNAHKLRRLRSLWWRLIKKDKV